MQKVELRCEICSLKFDSNYNVPKVLSCGHTVCSKCVDRMRDKSLNKCPFDRKILDLEDDGVAINYYILSMIDNDVKEGIMLNLQPDDEEIFELKPRPVINSPGWKNTIDGFIKNDVLYTVETNGFIYCTDLKTGEWWFMYHNQFFGTFFMENPTDNKMYLIDTYGSLFQIFNKNYYVQIGKKNSWRNTSQVTLYHNKLYSIELSNKLYESNLQTGKWREIVINKAKTRERHEIRVGVGNSFFSKSGGNEVFSGLANKYNFLDDEDDNKFFKNITMLVSTPKHVLFANKVGELYSFCEPLGEAKLVTKEFHKNIESYHANSTHVYFFEKNSKVLYRALIFKESKIEITESNTNSSNSQDCNSRSQEEIIEKFEIDLKKHSETSLSINSSNHSHMIKITSTGSNTTNSRSSKSNLYQTEVFLDFEKENILSISNQTVIVPHKVIANDSKIVVVDKIGDLYVFDPLTQKLLNKFQCLFMLRNCHLSNTALIGDGDLLLLDPIRLSLNKLNIIAGTEVIVLHSTKFLNSIKHIFSANSRIYFIDTQGNLYQFNEVDKKLTQIGNNSICKYIVDFAVYKNYILTIENNTLYRTNLNDGNYIEIKNEMCKNYEYFFADNVNIIFISRDDEIQVATLNVQSPSNKDKETINFEGPYRDALKLKRKFKYENLSSMTSVTYFRNHIIFFNSEKKSIESVNIEDGSHKVMVEDFAQVNMFISNNDFLACISKEGVIYKLYC
jgi:hypothetical protein